MVSTQGNAVDVSQNGDGLAKRLRAFMEAHNLSVEELAQLLKTPPEILYDWFNEDMPPPACLIALMVLVQTLPQERRQPVTHSQTAEPCGNDFRHGSDKDREEALRRVRAI